MEKEAGDGPFKKKCAVWVVAKKSYVSYVIVDGRQRQVSHFDVLDGRLALGRVGHLAARRRDVEPNSGCRRRVPRRLRDPDFRGCGLVETVVHRPGPVRGAVGSAAFQLQKPNSRDHPNHCSCKALGTWPLSRVSTGCLITEQFLI